MIATLGRLARKEASPILRTWLIWSLAAFAALSCSPGDLKKGREAYAHGDFGRALQEWQSLADRGVPEAQFRVGRLYDLAEGVSEDKVKAAFWYSKAAEAGWPAAQHNLALLYYYGEGVAMDKGMAVKWFSRAADGGNLESVSKLGWLVLRGEGTPKDTLRAVSLLRRAASAGDAQGQTFLGGCYLEGDGVPRDPVAAAKWFRKAAEQGFAMAENSLGNLYHQGVGVEKDQAQAVKWLRLASEQGNPEALHNLGVATDSGDGVPKDAAEATRFFQRAAELGLQESQEELGRRFFVGVGVRTDYVEAYFWYNLAAAAGSKSAASMRDTLAKLFMTGVQVAEAQRRASTWHARRAAGAAQSILGLLTKPDATCSGFVVSREGHVLTAAHGVVGFSRIRVRLDSGVPSEAVLVAKDPANDLALLKVPQVSLGTARFRAGRGPRLGDVANVVGFPLQGLVTSGIQIASGNVSGLAGPSDDARLLQITVPIQQGNSGGPVLDESGNVVGLVVAKLDALRIAAVTGDIPQNVSFAIVSPVARAFLESRGVEYQTSSSSQRLSTSDIAERARNFTVLVECWR